MSFGFGFMQQPRAPQAWIPTPRPAPPRPAPRPAPPPPPRPVARATRRIDARLAQLAAEVADRAGLPRAFVFALVDVESGWNAAAVNRATHDFGLFQINRQHFGKRGFPSDERAALDPIANARGALVLLSEANRRWRGDLVRIAAEYNGGYSIARRGPPYVNAAYIVKVLTRGAQLARGG
jgi:soluble lytic murein transglycosylase-like protein